MAASSITSTSASFRSLRAFTASLGIRQPSLDSCCGRRLRLRFPCWSTLGGERGEVENALVQQVTRPHVAHGGEHALPDVGNLLTQLLHQLLHALALEVLLRAAQVTGDDGELPGLGVGGDL